MEPLAGKKTYVVAVLMALYAISGLLLDQVSTTQAVEMVLAALALLGLRLGIKKGESNGPKVRIDRIDIAIPAEALKPEKQRNES